LNFLREKFRKILILKEFERFEWFEWFGPSPIELFNPGSRTSRRRAAPGGSTDRAAGVAAAGKAWAQLATGCGKLYRARSRLYRNEILQENMRLKALAEIYIMHSFAQLCNLNFKKIANNFAEFAKLKIL